MVEAEVDQPPEVDAAMRNGETELVSLYSSEPDPPVIVGHQPCDGSLHHRSPSSVVVGEVTIAPRAARFNELVVVSSDSQLSTFFGLGAALTERAVEAVMAEPCSAGWSHDNGVTGGQVAVRAS